jgi:hypothetical protein
MSEPFIKLANLYLNVTDGKVLLLDEVLKYNPKFLDSLPKNCYCIIRNFTGTVYSAYDDEGYTHFILKPTNPITRPIITD